MQKTEKSQHNVFVLSFHSQNLECKSFIAKQIKAHKFKRKKERDEKKNANKMLELISIIRFVMAK